MGIELLFQGYRRFHFRTARFQPFKRDWFLRRLQENIWILSSNDGLYRTTLDGKIWKDFNISKTNSLTSNTTYDMVEDNKGLIWVATASGLVTYSYESNTFSPVNQELASGAISSLEKIHTEESGMEKAPSWFASTNPDARCSEKNPA